MEKDILITVKDLRDALKGIKGDTLLRIGRPLSDKTFETYLIDNVIKGKEFVTLCINSKNMSEDIKNYLSNG